MSKINKLILGTVQFGLDYGINNVNGKLDQASIFQLLEEAYRLGIRTLDTAEAYGNAHEVIQNFHAQSSVRFNIISKYSSTVEGYSIDFVERINQHCNAFDVPSLYGYMFHSYEEFKKVYQADNLILTKLKSSGKVQKIGVSIYDNAQIEDLLQYDEINLIQLPFNLFDNESLRGDILRKAKNKGIEIHTRSAFLQGLFFKDTNALSGNLLDLKKDLESLNIFIKNNHLNKVNLALNYPNSKEYIDNVLIGVDSISQLKENISALENRYDKTIFEALDKIDIQNKELLNPSKWKK